MAMTFYECKLSSQNARNLMGKCIYCGKTEPMYDTKYCPECAEKELERSRKNYLNNPQKHLEKGNANRIKRRTEAKESGFCQSCFKRKVHSVGDYYCVECKVKIKKAKHKKNGTDNKKYIWKIEGKCSICGKDRFEDKKVCECCYSRLKENISVARSKRDMENLLWGKLNNLISKT